MTTLAETKAKTSRKLDRTFKIDSFNMAQPALIEASAGTGKTYSITNLVLRALLGVGSRENSLVRPLEIDELLIVTFTNAATADLRLRIYERIRMARLSLEDFINRALAMALAQLKDEGNAADKAPGMKVMAKKAKGLKAQAQMLVVKKDGASSYKALSDDERYSVSEELEQQLALPSNYEDSELNEIVLAIDIEAIFAQCQIKDDAIKFIIRNLLERAQRQGAPLRPAVAQLVRAERNINNAAICTIHSFCNSTLTQIYALEAGEAFNTELKTELSEEIHEAYYSVWRRLFYQKHSSALLLRRLGKRDPLEMAGPIKLLNGVRLSGDSVGFYGYQISGIDELLSICRCELDKTKPLEPQLKDYIVKLQEDLAPIESSLISICSAVLGGLPYEQFRRFVVPRSGQLKILEGEKNNIAIKSKIDDLLLKIAQCYELLPQAQALGAESVAWGDLLALLEQIAKSGSSLVSATNSIFNSRKKPKTELEKECVAQLDQLVVGLINSLKDFMDENEAFLHKSTQLLRLLTAIVMNQEFERRCKEQHVMSTDDILRRLDYALNLRGDAGKSLAHAIRAKYPLAMIDEFQDTDPIQFSIFSSIYLNAEALEQKAYCYLIGDPKQSIYAFRGSDINSYLKARDLIVKLTDNQGIYTLDTNYRSSPDVVAAANAIFDLTLNPNNVNPFNESRISFEPVKSGKAMGLIEEQRKEGFTKTITADDKNFAPGTCFNQGYEEVYGFKVHERSFFFSEDDEDEDEEENSAEIADGALPLYSSFPKPDYLPPRLYDRVISLYPSEDKVTGKRRAGKSEILAFSGPANSYVIDIKQVETTTKEQFAWAYAKASAAIIKDVLDYGRIVENGKARAVTPGDIAILVRKGSESELIQNELWNLQIASVYLSDRSSVLGTQEEPSQESLELGYLMEAMCDCTNRKKVFRVLGSRLLCLSAEEYQEQSATDNFEREVKLLSSCARTWQQYGFMPAFLQWAHDPSHNICKRLLALKDGERWYTNYCHIGEIIQGVHTQKSGIQAQLNWYYDLLYHNQGIFDEDVTKKRLESEQEQIKIITIHKSKGLEFPIVFMPFLWMQASGASNFDTPDKYLGVKRYYDPQEQHVVLDLNPDHEFKVQEQLPVYHSKTNSFEYGKFKSVPVSVNPSTIIETEERREAMRLLYVAITRARYANFMVVGHYEHRKIKLGDALVEIQGRKFQGYAVDVDNNDAIVNLESGEGLKEGAERFLNALYQHKECFTVIDGRYLVYDDRVYASGPAPQASYQELVKAQDLERSNKSEPSLKTVAAIKEALSAFTPSSYNMSELEPNQAIPPLAMSFVYRDAIDQSFNIFSYSSLVAGSGKYTQELQYVGSVEESSYDEDELDLNLKGDSIAALAQDVKPAVYPMSFEPQVKLDPELYDDSATSVSAFMNEKWLKQKQYYFGRLAQKRGRAASFMFPRGTGPGSFMHEVLQHVEFENAKSRGCMSYMLDDVFEIVFRWAHNQRYEQFTADQNESDRLRLALWFNDVLEAPIVAGRHHCFALTDLKAHSYEREMEFLMSNHSFNTQALNALCEKVARQLLSPELQEQFLNRMQLKEDELVGYITGSIDLACSIDLNARLPLREREDLLNTIGHVEEQELRDNLMQLRNEVMAGLHPELEADPELSLELGFEEMSVMLAEEDEQGANEKFFVIDYKSNYLGSRYEDYNYERMLYSVYEHRYDVQFLLYSLALYRFLKRRYAIAFDAPYEELRAFYEQKIGGVIYLFLRGMQANYLRDHISHGVFSTRLDFDVIYELDQIFSPHFSADSDE